VKLVADAAPAVKRSDSNEDRSEAVPTAAQLACPINCRLEIFCLRSILV
jgi:hypothetical protein